ncbi:MAG TPA: hypothetical protein VN937_14675 [Blastocatellia bacterium]|nr:hypothetical protein [Blastocatellia bacterium]
MKAAETTSYRITLTEFTIAFVSFGLLLGVALMAAETNMDVGMYRTIYSFWVTAALVIPALCAFVLPGDSPRIRTTWLLFWTFSFLAYLVHASYAVLSVYHGSFHEFLAGQGAFPAINNAIFTLWWALDLALAWWVHSGARWIRIERVAAHIYIGLTFVASTLFLKHGFVNVIGIVLTASVVICLMINFDARRSVKRRESAMAG